MNFQNGGISMNLSMDIIGNSLIVKLKGELDHHSSESTRMKIDSNFNGKNLINMIMDLNELTFMDSSGIGLIMGRYKNVTERNGELIIVCKNNVINRILDMSGLLNIIKLHEDLDTAIINIKGVRNYGK